jgi:hypothetical protein
MRLCRKYDFESDRRELQIRDGVQEAASNHDFVRKHRQELSVALERFARPPSSDAGLSIQFQLARVARELEASQKLNVTRKSADPGLCCAARLIRFGKAAPLRRKRIARLLLALLATLDCARYRDVRRSIGASRPRIKYRD